MSPDPVEELVRGVAARKLPPLVYQVLPRPRYLLVRYSGRVETGEIARSWFRQLESLLLDHSVDQILWDSRPAKPHPAEVRTMIWDWLEGGRVLKRSAILVESEMLRLSANLSAVGGTLRLQAFHRFDEAERWLSHPH
ncbi:MAG: hypothetical protein AAGF12_14445 [Myxococcota bacterium]